MAAEIYKLLNVIRVADLFTSFSFLLQYLVYQAFKIFSCKLRLFQTRIWTPVSECSWQSSLLLLCESEKRDFCLDLSMDFPLPKNGLFFLYLFYCFYFKLFCKNKVTQSVNLTVFGQFFLRFDHVKLKLNHSQSRQARLKSNYIIF